MEKPHENRATIWSTNPSSGYTCKELKTESRRDICPTMFTAVFKIAKRWEPPKGPSMDEWINKMWYIHTHTHNYYSGLKWKEILSHAATQTILEDIMLSEMKVKKKTYTVWLHLYEVFKVVKFKTTESRMVFTKNWGKEKKELYLLAIRMPSLEIYLFSSSAHF